MWHRKQAHLGQPSYRPVDIKNHRKWIAWPEGILGYPHVAGIGRPDTRNIHKGHALGLSSPSSNDRGRCSFPLYALWQLHPFGVAQMFSTSWWFFAGRRSFLFLFHRKVPFFIESAAEIGNGKCSTRNKATCNARLEAICSIFRPVSCWLRCTGGSLRASTRADLPATGGAIFFVFVDAWRRAVRQHQRTPRRGRGDVVLPVVELGPWRYPLRHWLDTRAFTSFSNS